MCVGGIPGGEGETDPNPVKQLFLTLTQGVYVIGVTDGQTCNAFTASSVMQVSMAPPMLAVAVNPGNASYPLLIARGIFAVSVLRDDQHGLAERFGNHSGRDENKLADVAWHPSLEGAPVLDAAMSYFDCRIVSRHPAGDHVLILAEVVGGDRLGARGHPLRYEALGDLDGSAELLPRQLAG